MNVRESVAAFKKNGLIFDIQKFSLHDGPGIRTTVFMKGCHLRCEWCSNPEGVKAYPEIMTFDTRCIKCGHCIKACPIGAISEVEGMRIIEWEKCDQCRKCAEVCPSGGIETMGKYISCDELMKEIEKDRLFYESSGGGVTFSGGEPLLQWEFLLAMLKRCKAENIHSCLDTTGCASWETMVNIIPYVDLVLYDIKHLDADCHSKRTGVDNRLILENLSKVAQKARLWLRIPLIPGYNDSRDHLKKVGEYAFALGVEKISLLPYHCWGEQKYDRLGRVYSAKRILPSSEEDVNKYKEYLKDIGVEVVIGR